MARCEGCGATVAEGCNCSVQDTDCIEILGNGEDDNPLRANIKFDPDPDNLASCTEDGLLGQLPDYIANPPACHVYRTTNQSFDHDDADIVTFNAERYDTHDMHDNATDNSRIYIPMDGVYLCVFDCVWNKDELGDRQVWIRKNGTDSLVSDSKHAGDADLFVGHSVACQEEFVEGDYIEAIAKQDSGGALLLLSDRFSPNFTCSFRRRATT